VTALRIFAIGVSGVLGAQLVPMLLDGGHDVTAMSPGRRLDALPPGVARVRASLLDEAGEQRLAGALAAHDAVLNVATAMPRDVRAPGAWELNTRVRVKGTRRLARAARSARIGRLIQMSITMAYPDGGDAWLDESTPFDRDPSRAAIVEPVSALEAAIRELPRDEPSWTILRGARFVGPGTIQDVHRRQLRERQLAVAGDERAFVSMVDVRDFARAVVAALESGAAPQTVLNISDEPVRRGPYLDRLARIEGLDRPPRAPECAPDLPAQRVDSRRARSMLAWTPRYGIWPRSCDVTIS